MIMPLYDHKTSSFFNFINERIIDARTGPPLKYISNIFAIFKISQRKISYVVSLYK